MLKRYFKLDKRVWQDQKFLYKFFLGLSGAILGYYLTIIYYPLQPYRIGLVDSPSIYTKLVMYKKINPLGIKFDIIKDNLYIFEFPKDTSYYKKGTEFVKYAKCLPGDKLEVKNLKYYCNGKYIDKARTKDSKGREVKPFVFNGIIPENKIFMYAPHPKSYDSRYWGFLDKNKIKGIVIWKL